ncbi:class I SAM-dependent methyltransferase [Rhizobium laguerreae]|uniref:50S ribosomal protein L11 methyltransferase n=1 Tax=Rhizobium laguerreae TaxID=1076926 RepID=UPI001C9119B2|nr:50S ribosomal protein L11 methyltransferase [Rhizobium laguerreae]MBY3515009.1 class I SAM-dependent methyltransferase [Rhizobium laguerreae]
MLGASSVDGVRVAGSFRDPAGYVFRRGDSFFRAVTLHGAADYNATRASGILKWLSDDGRLVRILDEQPSSDGNATILEVERLPWITHPYEWSFQLLKTAALFHLDLHLALLERKFTLSDATAYNVQFVGTNPIFIDHLSIRPYREGEFWTGHRQFCEQFLTPLLLRAYLDVPHNAWYRGSMEGIAVSDLVKILPLHKKLSWNVLTNIVLQDKFQAGTSSKETRFSVKERKLPKQAFTAMLRQMHAWISRLQPADKKKTVWADYSLVNTYNDAERQAKHNFVGEYVRSVGPKTVIDLGCNSGEYSERALASGATSVVGFDFDVQALDRAYENAISRKLNLLPLFLDARNPSPNQGWMGTERLGFGERMRADGLLALAFEHHLAIAHNVPLDQLVQWLLSVAPTGVIEFVPKSDPTVQRMLALRDDIFPNYDVHEFERILAANAVVERSEIVSQSGRTLFQFRRRR